MFQKFKHNECFLATGFPYDHGERWKANMRLFEYFTDKTKGGLEDWVSFVDLCIWLGLMMVFGN
ncbi:MAG: hypothetical protein CM1200mP1_14950 [Candidatus Neomarinimicrobiota bacterium]|nr:MAG: hypothetical protein CM1200mP1_14950 [Candidatus Neomarinimicrobiota bacterium]